LNAYRFPVSGDRIGFVSGPCQNPRDNAGMVLCISSNRFYSHVAHVLMDNGTTRTWEGPYTRVGIGAYLVSESKVAA